MSLFREIVQDFLSLGIEVSDLNLEPDSNFDVAQKLKPNQKLGEYSEAWLISSRFLSSDQSTEMNVILTRLYSIVETL